VAEEKSKGWTVDPNNPNRMTYSDPDGRLWEVLRKNPYEVPFDNGDEDKTKYGVPRLVPEPVKPQPEPNRIVSAWEQGGLSPEVKAKIQGKDNPQSVIFPALNRAGGEVIDLGAKVLNTIPEIALEAGRKVDQALNATGVSQVVDAAHEYVDPGSGLRFSAESAIGALMEAFPLGTAEAGGTILGAPKSGIKVNPAVRSVLSRASDSVRSLRAKGRDIPDFEKTAQEAFDLGATRTDMDNLSSAYGAEKFGEDLDKAIEYRDAGGTGVNIYEPKKTVTDRIEEGSFGEKAKSYGTSETRAELPQEEDIVTRLTDALKRAGPASKEQKALRTEERSNRLKQVGEARKMTEGEEGFRSELAALKGELPKAEFEGIKGEFTQDDLNTLFDRVKNHEGFGKSLYDSINARTGLAKLLDGELPAPKELDLLNEVFGKEFTKAVLDQRSKGIKLTDLATEAINVPRAMMSSMDLSAPGRQGIFLVGRKEYWKNFAGMFKQAWSEKAFQAVRDEVKSRDTYPLMEESKLSLSGLGSETFELSKREEAYMGANWAEKIPVAGRLVKGSERAYVGFLNKLRADTFDSLISDYKKIGIDVTQDPEKLREIAKYINDATGRGELPKSVAQAGPLLNSIFFSPRLMMSRVNIIKRTLDPRTYTTLDPVMRKRFLYDLTSFGGIATTALSLAAGAGLDVEVDPRSSDFGKIRSGKTRYDILGGFGQYLTLGARLVSNQTKTIKGEVKDLEPGFGKQTRLDVISRFFTNKEAPVASFITDWLRGENVVGEPFEVKKALLDRFIPMFVQDVMEMQAEYGFAQGTAIAAPGLFGVGTQTFDQVPSPVFEPKEDTPVSLEIKRLEQNMRGKLINPPSKSFNAGKTQTGEDIKENLSDEDYNKYVRISDYIFNSFMEQAMSSEEWSTMDDVAKRKEVKQIVKDARTAAKEMLNNSKNEDTQTP